MGFPQKMQERGIIERKKELQKVLFTQWEMLQMSFFFFPHFLQE